MRKTVAVDLDGVLAFYDGWRGIDHIGEPIRGAVDFVRELHVRYHVVIYSTRCKEFPDYSLAPSGAVDSDRRPVAELAAVVRGWLDRHGFRYDEVYVGQGKPFAVAYVDDRAVPCRPQDLSPAVTHYEYEYALAKVRELANGFDPKYRAW